MSKSKGPMTDQGLTPLGAKIVGALSEFRDVLRDGRPVEEVFTVRTLELRLEPRHYTSENVRETRRLLNLSQALFARFLGVDVKTVRSWEQGLKQPSPMACRFMDEIATAPDYWRKRVRDSAVAKGSQPVG